MEQRTVNRSRLYDADGTLYEFDAVVRSCTEENGLYAVTLDCTAFFPGGGGQDCDTGTINGIRTIRIAERGGEVLHLLREPLSVGSSVHGSLDREARIRKMQAHGGEHVLSGLLNSLYGAENVGFRIGSGELVTVDTSIPLSRTQLDTAELEANRILTENRTIRVFFPTPEELATLSYRSKLSLTEGVRIVEIDGVDRCACCAPHFSSTAPIGLLKILDTLPWHGGTRLFLVCGLAALDDYRSRWQSIKEISGALSAKQEQVADAVHAALAREAEQKSTLFRLRRALRDAQLAALGERETEGSLVLFDDLSDSEGLRDYANRLAARCQGIGAAFCASSGGFTYAAASHFRNMKEEAPRIHAALGGKGGGTPQMIFGTVTAAKQEIENYFKKS